MKARRGDGGTKVDGGGATATAITATALTAAVVVVVRLRGSRGGSERLGSVVGKEQDGQGRKQHRNTQPELAEHRDSSSQLTGA